MENESYDRRRVRRLLKIMTDEVCMSYPLYTLREVWRHVEGAMQILHDTKALTYDERLNVVETEYNVCHQPDNDMPAT
jgi:hypothetical protein